MFSDEQVYRISRETHPRMFDLLDGKKDIIQSPYFINITESKLIKLGGEDLLNSPKCPVCGRKIPEGLLPDWRGDMCLSKYHTCGSCTLLADSVWFKMLQIRCPKEKNDFLKELLAKNETL